MKRSTAIEIDSTMTIEDMVARLAKIHRKRVLRTADRKEADELVWMLKQMAVAGQEHKCVPKDYGEEYAVKALRTENTRAFIIDHEGKPNLEWSHLLHAVIGMVTESAEALDSLKKTLVYGKPIDYINLLEEAGDEKWYLALLLRTLKKTDREAGELNVQKLLVRYPIEFSKDKALTRDLAAERAVFAPKATGETGGVVSFNPNVTREMRHRWDGATFAGEETCAFCGKSVKEAAPGPCPSRKIG